MQMYFRVSIIHFSFFQRPFICLKKLGLISGCRPENRLEDSEVTMRNDPQNKVAGSQNYYFLKILAGNK
jgi:hypothetical protein